MAAELISTTMTRPQKQAAGRGVDPGVSAAIIEPIESALVSRGVRATVLSLGVHDAFRSAGSRSGSAHGPDPTAGISIHVPAQQAIVGPISGSSTVHPACDTCLARRWQAVRPEALREGLELGTATRRATSGTWVNPFAADALVALVALAEDAVATDSAVLNSRYSTVLALDLERLTLRRENVIADPSCPHCGPGLPDSAELASLQLGSVPKPDPSTFRRQHIDAYSIEAGAFANSLCGALGPSVVLDVTSTTTSATVGCLTVRSGGYLRETFWGGHEGSFADSLLVGMFEGLERLAGMRPQAKQTAVFAALDDLAVPAVDPRTCGLYDPEFYAQNPWVREFAANRPIPWVWGWSLRDHHPIMVPEVLTYYHTPSLENRFVQESSNGCASGGCLEEAVYFGLMEVIERDAFLLGWYGREPLPEIDPLTSSRPQTRAMVHRLAMYGYRARFFDARVTFDLPVVAGVAERIDGGLGTLCFGAGASLDPEDAMAAAMCEIATDAANAQRRATYHEQRLRAMVTDFDNVRQLHDHPLVYGTPEMREHASFLLDNRPAPVSVAERFELIRPAPPRSMDLRDDVNLCVEMVTDAGFDVVVIDQTLPEQRELGLATCDVVVPGLLPIDFGWSRQRARTMPRTRTARREAGLRVDDLLPEQINPAPHPFP